MQDYLERQDPIKKAERALDKNKKQVSPVVNVKPEQTQLCLDTVTLHSTQLCPDTVKKSNEKYSYAKVSHTFAKREPLSANVKHQVNLRDKNQCTYIHNGQRCSNQRWLHIHHINPVAKGGQNSIQNLTTLCSSHHRFLHN